MTINPNMKTIKFLTLALALPVMMTAQSEVLMLSSYNVSYSHTATIPETMTWDETDFMLRGHLKPIHQEKSVTQEVLDDYQLRTTIEISSRDDEEEWMNLPYKFVFDCERMRGYDKHGELITDIPLSDDELAACNQQREEIEQHGYSIGYTHFPMPEPENFDYLEQEGFTINQPLPGVIEISKEDENFVEIFNQTDLSIISITLEEESFNEIINHYEYFESWGYLPVSEVKRQNLSNGIVITDTEIYTNHQVEGHIEPQEPLDTDSNGETVSLMPNPVETTAVVRVEDAPGGLQAIDVYSLQSELLLSLEGNGQTEQEIDLQSLTPNLYVLKVQTSQNSHSLIFEKN